MQMVWGSFFVLFSSPGRDAAALHFVNARGIIIAHPTALPYDGGMTGGYNESDQQNSP